MKCDGCGAPRSPRGGCGYCGAPGAAPEPQVGNYTQRRVATIPVSALRDIFVNEDGSVRDATAEESLRNHLNSPAGQFYRTRPWGRL